MPALLEQLLHDLLQRYRFLRDELVSVPSGLSPEVLAYRDRLQTRVERFISAIDDLLADPDLSQPSFARNIFHIYKRLSEFAQAADEGPVFALSRFAPRDLFLTRLVADICREFAFPHTPPLCTAMSTQYYCTITGMDLLLLPHSEPNHLLGLPDIYHELGHIILFRDSALLTRLRNRSQAHFQREILRAQSEGWPANSVAALETYRNRWLGEWSIEFGCDLIATYVCGPAFGWTNARLCARLSPDFYEIINSHPADAARTSAIKLMIQHLGFYTEAHQIDLQWEELRKTAVQQEPQEFHLAFPTSLLEELVQEVVAFCPAAGIKPYTPGSMPIAKLLNDAWTTFLSSPGSYATWEVAQIAALKTRVMN
jgi:hypothetical protein